MVRKRWIAATLLGVLALAAQTPSPAVVPCSLTIPEYPGSSEKEGREDTIDVYAVDHEVYVPINPDTGAPVEVRKHKPLTVLKIIDKSSPGLHHAMTTAQTLNEVTLDFYRIDPATRQETKYFIITLTDVQVIGDKLMVPTSFDPAYESYGHMEEIRFNYREIEWEWLPDGFIEHDNWGPPKGGKDIDPAGKAAESTAADRPSAEAQSAKPAD